MKLRNRLKQCFAIAVSAIMLCEASATLPQRAYIRITNPIVAEAAEDVLHTRKFDQWSYKSSDYELYEAGCGLFATGNAIYAFTGKTIDISALKTWAKSVGGWTASAGLYPGTYFPKLAKSTFASDYGFTVSSRVTGGITANNKAIATQVSKKNVAAIIGVPNHYMVITDYDSSTNKYFVIESAVSGSAYRNLPAASWVSESKLSSGNTLVKSYVFLTFSSSSYNPGSVSGEYYLKNNSTGTYAYMNGSDANTTDIALAAKKTTSAYQMKFTPVNSSNAQLGSYIMPAASTTRVLNPYADNPADGTNVNMYTKNTDGTQYWIFEKVSAGYVIHNNYNTNLVLTAVSGTVKLKTYSSGNTAQIWTLESIPDPLSSISVTSNPTKKSYYLGETLKTDGMKVTATYESGTTKDVTSAVKTSYDFSKAGTATVTVSYTEDGATKTATFTVSVEETPVLFEGSGTEADPYLIQSKKDLETFRDAVNDTSLNPTYAHAYYLQTADIDLEEEEWIPIGVGYDGDDYLGAYNYQTRMFYGVYDGGKHYIKGLKITKDYNESGLFGVLRDNKAMVCNLVVYGSVNNSYGNAGGICSTIHYGAVVQNCGFVGDITCKTNKSAGGVVSAIWASGTVSDCYHCGNVTSNGNAAGIIASTAFGQYNSDGDTALIQNCYHANGTISGKEHSGAIVAYCTYYDGINNTVTIKNCYASTDSGANADAEGATVNTTQLLRASEMQLLAEDLGSSFANTPDKNLNDGYPVFTWQIRVAGDITQDSVISVEDVIVMQKYLHAKQKITKAQFEVADVNSDGKVNVYDLALLKRKLLQK